MKSKHLSLCVMGMLLLPGGSLAQTSGRTGSAPPATPERRALAGSQRGMVGANALLGVLTDEQRRSFREVMRSQREKVRDLATQLRTAREQLLEAGVTGKFDEADVRQKAMAVAKLEADLAVLRFKAISEIQPPLSPEQARKILAALPARPRGEARILRNGELRRSLVNTNRDDNDLPPKQ